MSVAAAPLFARFDLRGHNGRDTREKSRSNHSSAILPRMNQPPNLPVDQNKLRLAALFDSASKHATAANQRAVQVSVDIGKERAQYFEKIALASGGTIALVVSFVGSHAGRLQPPWYLR